MSSGSPDDCYDYPQYWDLAFRSETRLEADFIEAAGEKYGDGTIRRLLEPGCGGGRLTRIIHQCWATSRKSFSSREVQRSYLEHRAEAGSY
jgi:hypothetical protein